MPLANSLLLLFCIMLGLTHSQSLLAADRMKNSSASALLLGYAWICMGYTLRYTVKATSVAVVIETMVLVVRRVVKVVPTTIVVGRISIAAVAKSTTVAMSSAVPVRIPVATVTIMTVAVRGVPISTMAVADIPPKAFWLRTILCAGSFLLLRHRNIGSTGLDLGPCLLQIGCIHTNKSTRSNDGKRDGLEREHECKQMWWKRLWGWMLELRRRKHNAE